MAEDEKKVVEPEDEKKVVEPEDEKKAAELSDEDLEEVAGGDRGFPKAITDFVDKGELSKDQLY